MTPDEHVPTALAPWETLAIDAVGDAIEFWGFKRNQGRVWALLYLRGRRMTAQEIEETLELSKGAVHMVTHELQRWGVIERARTPGSAGVWTFSAETDLMAMVGRVLKEREAPLVARVRQRLEEAEARASKAPKEVRERLSRMRVLALYAERAIDGMIRTARIDLKRLLGVLRHPTRLFGGS